MFRANCPGAAASPAAAPTGPLTRCRRRADRGSIIAPASARAPAADAVEVLQRQTDRIHEFVTTRARRALPVRLHALAHGLRLARLLVERRHVGRRLRRRRTQNVRQHVLAAHHRRGPVVLRVQRQDAAVAEQSPALLVRDRDAAELSAVDVRQAVVARQPFVDERVVRAQQVDTLLSSRTTLSKSSSVSRCSAWRRLSSKSGNTSSSG